jgi:hypothetical protein
MNAKFIVATSGQALATSIEQGVEYLLSQIVMTLSALHNKKELSRHE